MVEKSGTDDFAAYNLPNRVDRLEAGQQAIHQDLAGIKSSQDIQGKVLSDIAEKLDTQRTRQPNLMGYVIALVAIVGLGLTYGELQLAPMWRELNASALQRTQLAGVLLQRAELIGAFGEAQDGIEKRVTGLEDRMLARENNQYTKSDAQFERELTAEEIARIWAAIRK